MNINCIAILVALCLFDSTTGRPSKVENLKLLNRMAEESRKRRDVTELPEEEYTTAMNDEYYEEYRTCLLCLNECTGANTDFQKYYYCAGCVRSCNGNVDALMQYFTSHTCVAEQKHSAISTPIPGSEISNQLGVQSSPSTSDPPFNRSKHLNGPFVSNVNVEESNEVHKCPDLYSRYEQCLVDLGNRNSGSIGSNTNEMNILDSEKPNFQITKPSSNNAIKMNDIGGEDSSLQIRAIVQEHRSRFIKKTELRKLQIKFDMMPDVDAVTKSASNNRKPICPTKYVLDSPDKATHHSKKFGVELFKTDELIQHFFIGHCEDAKPLVSVTASEPGTCAVITSIQPALILVEEKYVKDDKYGFENCTAHGNRYLCNDYILLAGGCSLYL